MFHQIFLVILKVVSLIDNKISEIQPRALSHLEYCRILALRNNVLTEVRKDMWEGLGSLQELWLDNNEISRIQPGAFSHLRHCALIVLSNNKLTEVRADMWYGANVLDVLWLGNNYLAEIKSETFTQLENLHELILSQNRIFHIEANSFSIQNQHPVRIDLDRNELTTLSETAFRPQHPAVLQLSLGGNPLHCDARLMWLKHWEHNKLLRWKLKFFNHMPRRSGPAEPECANFPGVAWSEVQLEVATQDGKKNLPWFLMTSSSSPTTGKYGAS